MIFFYIIIWASTTNCATSGILISPKFVWKRNIRFTSTRANYVANICAKINLGDLVVAYSSANTMFSTVMLFMQSFAARHAPYRASAGIFK